MNRFQRRLLLPLSLIALVLTGARAEASPFGGFIRALRHSIGRHHREAHSRKLQPESVNSVEQQGEAVKAPLLPPPPPDIAPDEVSVRRNTDSPVVSNNAKLPSGIPVANREGFVTSPYAPKRGLVDVRGFPSGTEVKDPYTGKVFLTP